MVNTVYMKAKRMSLNRYVYIVHCMCGEQSEPVEGSERRRLGGAHVYVHVAMVITLLSQVHVNQHAYFFTTKVHVKVHVHVHIFAIESAPDFV